MQQNIIEDKNLGLKQTIRLKQGTKTLVCHISILLQNHRESNYDDSVINETH